MPALDLAATPQNIRLFFPRHEADLWTDSSFLSRSSPYLKTLLSSDFAESVTVPSKRPRTRRGSGMVVAADATRKTSTTLTRRRTSSTSRRTRLRSTSATSCSSRTRRSRSPRPPSRPIELFSPTSELASSLLRRFPPRFPQMRTQRSRPAPLASKPPSLPTLRSPTPSRPSRLSASPTFSSSTSCSTSASPTSPSSSPSTARPTSSSATPQSATMPGARSYLTSSSTTGMQ
ncbi:hypothetical protein AAT19DRAFT_13188 [Rhodotorula toruloides]|uniref:Uncharacterized protein n=1 Tax=Rhodotorula toruloides TaxID=5286 RepID=A0A2T0ADS3_RHOTO|nr:hypothetical protein AAT19DRAFT_13188 [Rhodotorula toruloides]